MLNFSKIKTCPPSIFAAIDAPVAPIRRIVDFSISHRLEVETVCKRMTGALLIETNDGSRRISAMSESNAGSE
jgi:hypothetical protein